MLRRRIVVACAARSRQLLAHELKWGNLMVRLTRRDALAGLALAWGGAVPDPGHAHAMPSGAASGRLHALGMNPALFPEVAGLAPADASVLSTLDLSNGQLRQTLLPMAGGHATASLGRGHVLCVAHHKPKSLVVASDHSVVTELVAEVGHVFGGHAWTSDERQIFLLPQKRIKAQGLADTGSVAVYDAVSWRKIDQIDTGGIHPHEIHAIPGTSEIAVTHYGDIARRHRVLEHHAADPKLTILDARTFRPKRHYPLNDLNAMVTHMRVAPDGWAHLVLTQYVSWPADKTVSSFQAAIQNLESAIGRKPNFEIPRAALDERLLPLPLPLVAINSQTGERRIVNAGDRYHLRSQSVAYNTATGLAIAVYSHSDNLVLARDGVLAGVITAAELGLRNIRGVAELPGTPLIALMGAYRGVALYDLSAKGVAKVYETHNFLDTHLQFAPA
jgi:hypothetical protein